jgi:hypothetical protein
MERGLNVKARPEKQFAGAKKIGKESEKADIELQGTVQLMWCHA